MTLVVLNALNIGVVLELLNFTFISLIPKIKYPKKVSDYRPISFCNIIYKLISKVLVNRLNFFWQVPFLNLKVHSYLAILFHTMF